MLLGEIHDAVRSTVDDLGARAGLRRRGGEVYAEPFGPSWLGQDGTGPAMDAPPEPRRPVESAPAETFLDDALGFKEWNSVAQKEAVWTAITARPRSSTLIALPTGAGKSLCFQLAANYSAGLTVVIVPTVALAIDHWRSAQKAFRDGALRPRYYAAEDSSTSADEVIDAVRNRQCRLLFTSPEACVSGRLRPMLACAAKEGWLENLVIDEAHLVDTWGMYFRVDFQVLAALRRQWLAEPYARMRTLLLSATFTTDCRRILRHMFAEENTHWNEVASQRLRPEISYYLGKFTSAAEREQAVIECMWSLPRPAIIYTTTRDDARHIEQVARREGFRRVGCFHGNTPAAQRMQLLDAWKGDQIDLMVATSAFGMGVDKSDVRSVVHACLPEDLHRYYQEVGRAGRDGGSATCVLLPLLRRDEQIAKGLAPRLLTPGVLQLRWSALWATAEKCGEDPNVWKLRTDARPVNLIGDITGKRNVMWNKRLLLQLARARMLEVIDIRRRLNEQKMSRDECANEDERGVDIDVITDSTPDDAVVRINLISHSPNIGSEMSVIRERELASIRAGLDHMKEYLTGRQCIGRILRKMYGAETAHACGGCPACRRLAAHIQCPKLPVTNTITSGSARRQIVADVPSPFRTGEAQEFRTFVLRLASQGYRRFICAAAHHRRLLAAIGSAWPTAEGVYRLDTVEAITSITISDTECVAVFHVDALIDGALRLTRGSRVLHLITAGTPHVDGAGRRPLELDDVPYFPMPNLWTVERIDVY